jgi:acetylornithine deacetylase
LLRMDPIKLTRRLVDIESISGNEGAVGAELYEELCRLGYTAHKMPVAHERFNVVATLDEPPQVVFSTHMDTVPPFIPSSEDGENIYGRGSCDAKGIIAAMIAACQRLRKEGAPVGMLFVVGEERDSLGAKVANENSPGSRFLINGEPTENRVAMASKGAFRVQITAQGKMAHSAYPELGESAIEKLLVALERLRAMELPVNPDVGPCTMNIGLIEGGRAPNVIPDHARAHLLYRLVGPSAELRERITAAVEGLAEAEYVLEIPFARLRTVPGIETMVAKFTTDIPWLTKWGTPVLIGPGSIHVAHTEREHIPKKQLHDAVDLYCGIARKLLEESS